MKRIISTFIAIIGLTLLAVFDASAAIPEVRYDWPKVNGLPINNACATDQTLQSIEPIQVCIETGVVGRQACVSLGHGVQCRTLLDGEMPRAGEVVRDDVRCTSRQLRQVEVSRNVMDVSCAEYSNVSIPGTNDCIRYVRRSIKLGRKFFIAKFERHTQGEVYVGDDSYVIPACQSSN